MLQSSLTHPLTLKVGINKLVVFALDEETENTMQGLNVSVVKIPSLQQICPECSNHQVFLLVLSLSYLCFVLVLSCLVLSCLVLSCLVLPCLVLSCNYLVSLSLVSVFTFLALVSSCRVL
jgi:hypothetical protein